MPVEWDVYEVEIEFVKPVVGGIPKSKDVLAAWVESRARKKGKTPEEIQKLIEKIHGEVYISEDELEGEIDKITEKVWLTFKADREGLYLEDRNIKAMLREAATTMDLFRGSGSTRRKQRFQHGLTIRPYRIRFYRDGKVIKDPEDTQDRPVIIEYWGQTMAALRREDLVLPGARMKFYICVYAGGDQPIKKEHIEDMMDLAQEMGLGAARSQGFGKFRVVRISGPKRMTTRELPE